MPVRFSRSRPSPKFRLLSAPANAWTNRRRSLTYAATVAFVAIVAVLISRVNAGGAGTKPTKGPARGAGATSGVVTSGGLRTEREDGGHGPSNEGGWEDIDGQYGPRVSGGKAVGYESKFARPSVGRKSSSSSSSSSANVHGRTKAGVAPGDARASSLGNDDGMKSLNGSNGDEKSPLFHQVFTNGDQYLSTINVRSMESIFFIYPEARLRLYFNKRSKFSESNARIQPLLKAGYDITLVPYDPKELLEEAVRTSVGHEDEVDRNLANAFINNINVLRKEKFWYSNESNLLRLCLLYTVGGTYLDTDVVLVKPFGTDVDDAVAAGSKGSSIHCAVLRFSKPRNRYLSAAINNFLANYNGNKWGNNGPSAFRRTIEEHPNLICRGDVGAGRKATTAGKRRPDCWLNILSAETFAPVRWRDWEETCAKPGSSPVGSDAVDLISNSYAVHLNNQVTGPLLRNVGYVKGSVCDLVLSKFCTVCS